MKKFFIVSLVLIMTNEKYLFAAEAGMPQLDPKYWASQAFWLILTFSVLYISISNFFLPKLKNNLNDRDNKIQDDLDEAKNLKELAEKKQKEYTLIIESAKRDVLKTFVDSKKKLDEDIQKKKKLIEIQIEKELKKAESDIEKLKVNSIKDIAFMSEELASRIIENISGEKINESSLKAAIAEITKKDMEKNL